jgi:hypothetical protein
MRALWRNRPPPRFRTAFLARLAVLCAIAAGGLTFAPVALVAWLGAALSLFFGLAAAFLASTPAEARTQNVELVPTPDGVEVRYPGEAPFPLETIDLLGVSTCQNATGVDVAITHRSQPHRPFVFEGLRPEEVEPLRRALGVPQGGIGGMAFPSGSAPGPSLALQILSYLAALGTAATYALGAWSGEPMVTVSLGMYGAVPLFVLVWTNATASANRMARARSCVMQPWGLQYRELDAVRTLPYAEMRDIVDTDGGIAVTMQSGLRWQATLEALTAAERAHWARQLRSARDRAVASTGMVPGVDVLGTLLRHPGEPLRAWLERVDSVNVFPAGEGTYRAMGVPEPELWQALEDPDTPLELRIAISRRLGRRDPTSRTRVDDALKRLHAADDRTRVRIAVEAELAELPAFVQDPLILDAARRD